MNKKIKSVKGSVAKKTGELIKKAKKEWKKERPRREEYKTEIKEATNKILENSVKIGVDVANIIKKDINNIIK